MFGLDSITKTQMQDVRTFETKPMRTNVNLAIYISRDIRHVGQVYAMRTTEIYTKFNKIQGN